MYTAYYKNIKLFKKLLKLEIIKKMLGQKVILKVSLWPFKQLNLAGNYNRYVKKS